MSSNHPLRLAVALDGAGWHSAAWREPGARPEALFTPGYWVQLAQRAEQAGIDFLTIEDSLALQSDDRFTADEDTRAVRGRLDALLIANRIAPNTERIGLIPTITTTHTEPFHVSTAVATLDYTSAGRAGWQARVSIREDEAAHFGRKKAPGADSVRFTSNGAELNDAATALFAEATEVVEVVRRLWDSWEDDAEIRDAGTDRFVDSAKIHTVDFAGENFSVRGPSITPRSPQGQPVIAALAHAQVPYQFAASSADLVFTTPQDSADHAREVIAKVRAAEEGQGRTCQSLRIYADLLVVLDSATESGAQRLARLDAQSPLASDARILSGSAAQVAQEIANLSALGYEGIRLRPAVLPDDLDLIATDLIPELIQRGLFADQRGAENLRDRLGLPTQVASRYATSH